MPPALPWNREEVVVSCHQVKAKGTRHVGRNAAPELSRLGVWAPQLPVREQERSEGLRRRWGCIQGPAREGVPVMTPSWELRKRFLKMPFSPIS